MKWKNKTKTEKNAEKEKKLKNMSNIFAGENEIEMIFNFSFQASKTDHLYNIHRVIVSSQNMT